MTTVAVAEGTVVVEVTRLLMVVCIVAVAVTVEVEPGLVVTKQLQAELARLRAKVFSWGGQLGYLWPTFPACRS